jgi:pyruvate,orthophosphate dikinase
LVGCADLKIDLEHRRCQIGEKLLNEGDLLSLDGNTGGVYLNRVSTFTERPVEALAAIALWNSAAA